MASKVQRAKKFWESQATDLVRELMNEADFSYDELQEALTELGVDNLQTDSLQQKIARGTFPASMLLRVLFLARRGPFHSSDEKVAAIAKKLDITHTMNRLELGLARLAELPKKK